jgi:hypothetical protein
MAKVKYCEFRRLGCTKSRYMTRSVDGLNTHDEAYLLSIAGGVTTAVVLPGTLYL